jgi:capsular exopolysaccharide synthesis family protein
VNNFESSGATNEQLGGLLLPHDAQQFTQLHGLQGLLRVVTRRLKWIVISIVACELLAIVITLRTKPVYQATATIELNKSGSGSMDLGLGNILSEQLSSNGDSLLIDQQTETAILQGDSLALEVIQRLGLASDPPFAAEGGNAVAADSGKDSSLEESPAIRTRLLKIFKSDLKVNPFRGTRLIQVAYQSHDPKQAARIANAIIDSYKNQYLQSHYNATSEASDWLTKQLSELKTNVEDSEKKLTDFEKESGIISLNLMPTGSGNESTGEGQIHSVVIQKLDELNANLTAAETNRIEKEAIYHLVQTSNDEVVLGLGNDPLALQSNSMVLTQGGGLSNLQQLRQHQNELKVNIANASATYGANNRHLKEMQTELSTVNEQIHQELQEIIKRAQADFQLAQQTEDEIRRRFDEQQAVATKLNEKTVQFAVLSQEAYSRKKLYEDLYTKLQEANVSAGLKATNITIVDPARSQSVPVLPNRRANLALGMLFGLFVGVSSAFAIDTLDRTVSDPLEAEEITGKPVIGVIPVFGEKGRTYGARLAHEARRLTGTKTMFAEEPSTSVWMLHRPDSVSAEAFRILRTSIMLSRAGGGLKILLVTGCTPGEGKTTVTANLAVAFAQHNKKVLIIEADMRRPKLKHKMEFPGDVGLSNVLSGSCSSEDAIIRGLYVPTLDVLPAGPRPPMPSEILGSAAFDELLKKLHACYDIILIDSPPALVVTDAVIMSAKADAVLWVAQAGVITRPQLARASHLIERNRIPVIGFVMNRMSRQAAGYGYGYGYEYDIYGSQYGEENLHDA